MSRRSPDAKARAGYVAAWNRAKKANPSLTQAEFVNEGRSRAGLNRLAPDSASRYHRKIIAGERTGSEIWKRATEPMEKGLYQVQWRDPTSGRYFSVNLSVANATSTFDIVSIENELREKPKVVADIITRFQSKYWMEAADIRSMRFSIRQVAKQRRDVIRLVI